MAATTKVPLGGTTTNRKWYMDVDTSATASPTWVGVFGITEFKRLQDATTQDASDFDGEGWGTDEVTALKHGCEFKVRRAPTAADAEEYDAGQEHIRGKSLNTGVGNRVHYRIYEMEPDGPRVEAYEGYGAATWSEDGGAMSALSTVSVKLLGQGKLLQIDHPDAE